MTNTTCIVTGANSGIGKATVRGLAKRGAHVVMVCRSEERGEAARREIIDATGHDGIDLLLADLAAQVDIRALAEAVIARYDRLDVLVNNAGIYQADRQLTPDGIEMTWAVNHLAYFLLTNLLRDLLMETAEAHGEARVVNVASEAYKGGTIDLDDPGFERSDYSGMQAYARSKLANLLFTYELARRWRGTGVTATCVHPGVVATGFWDRNSDWLSWAGWLFKWMYKSPESGARGPLYLATSSEVEGVTGAYFDGTEPVTPEPKAYDEETAQRLWERSVEMTGLPISN
jgi:NAD(P)-dependent dehydrogenase (short-subunit alcohol dehydrogenase family)